MGRGAPLDLPPRLAGEEGRMKLTCLIVIGFALASMGAVGASAQQAVRPQWNYQGSAVCPEGYDYLGGLCRARGYGGGGPHYGSGYGGGGYGGGGIEPRWN